MLLPEPEFFMMCKTGLDLTLVLDPHGDIPEVNEYNNRVTISDVTVTDSGNGLCSGMLELTLVKQTS